MVECGVKGCWTLGWPRRVHIIGPSNTEASLSRDPLTCSITELPTANVPVKYLGTF